MASTDWKCKWNDKLGRFTPTALGNWWRAQQTTPPDPAIDPFDPAQFADPAQQGNYLGPFPSLDPDHLRQWHQILDQEKNPVKAKTLDDIINEEAAKLRG